MDDLVNNKEIPLPCLTVKFGEMDCPNMKMVNDDWNGERYKCNVCGKVIILDYDEMK